MITIKAFRAWRPDASQVERVACVPYDVVNAEEAREMAKGNPESFLHVVRPEINLPEPVDEHADEVYATGAEKLREFMDSGILKQDDEESLFVYRLIWNGRAQTGLFSCVSVKDYDEDRILKHELTRPDKEDDRTRHIREQEAHAEPVMLTCKGSERINEFFAEVASENPMYNFTANDGVQHTLWKVEATHPLRDAFANLDALYVADGHHRCKSASRLVEYKKEKNLNHDGTEEYNFFPAVIFPKDQMEILPYNRVIHKTSKEVFEKLAADYGLQKTHNPSPQKKGDVCVYYDGVWYGFTLPQHREPDSVQVLDAARLQEFIFAKYFGIEDPRTDSNISFVGGIRGTKELQRLVDSKKAVMGFSVYPTSIQELIDVSDEGKLMPPKSTWFEPKLRSGLLIHTF